MDESMYINMEINVCIDEDKYDECYDYLQEMRQKITDEILNKYQGTSESYLE